MRIESNMWHWVEDEDGCEHERHIHRRTMAITFVYFWDNARWFLYKMYMKGERVSGEEVFEDITRHIQGVLGL